MRKGIFTIILLSLLAHTYGQKTLHEIIRGERGLSSHFTILAPDQQTIFSLHELKSALDLDKRSDLVLMEQQADKLRFTHYRFYQTLEGIPIENSMYIMQVQNDKLTKLSGAIITDFDEYNDYSPIPSLSPAQAIEAALKLVHANVYMWQEAGMERRIKEQTGNAAASFAPTATLAWYNAGDELNPRNLRLAYKIDVYAKQPLSRADYFIDAKTGEYLGKKDKIFFSDATGTAATAYSGTQTIHSDLNGGSYRLRDYTKGGGIITLHGESGVRGNDYASASANWNLSGIDVAALDAHYGVSQTYSFYISNFNRNSYDNKGTALYSYVNDPTYIDNAFWDGLEMNFNERSTGAPGGVTGIDVTGHELTHGVTQTTSALNYSGESGAMNESMSDIMGKSVQFWSKPADINWKLSNDMSWLIRDLSNPNGYSQPDTYNGTFWYTGANDNGGVHTNSGVGNFMFYLLVTGGSGKNDIGNSYTVTGIGLSEADQIIYRSETAYLTPTSKYADWRAACINAATDIYGATSKEVIQVENAWYAVGVGTAGSTGGSSCNITAALGASNITSTGATLGWSAVSGATRYNVQWKAASSSTWTTVTGITTTSYTLSGLTASTAYQFQVQTICSGGSSSYSAATTFTTTAVVGITYCASKGTTQTYEWIKQVTFGTINNTSNNSGGYGNFTNLSTTVKAGSSYTITLKPGFSGTAYREYWTVYIDFNDNGTLNNTGETVIRTSSTTASGTTASIAIPKTAKNGPARMRIQMHYGSQVTNPCATLDYGEVEDYTVNISGGSGFNALTAQEGDGEVQKASILAAPNPVRGSNAFVVYHLSGSGLTTINVVDLMGRILRLIPLGSQTNGVHSYNLELNKMVPGNYILVLEQNAKIVARSPFLITK